MNTHATSPASDANTWLTQQSKQARVLQLQVFVVRLAQLAAQISAFWFLASIVHRVVVEQQAVFFSELSPLIVAMLCWAILVYLQDWMGNRMKSILEQALEDSIHQRLKSNQVALTRRFSSTFWQQLFLNNISDIGDYLTQYSVQKWLAGIGPVVVLLVITPINYVVAIALFVTMPVVPLFMILVGKGAASLHRKHFIALERLGDMFSDRLKALPLITVTGQHHNQVNRLSDASEIVNRKTMQVVSIAFLSTTVLDFFATVSIALVAVFIGFTMLGELSIGPQITLHSGLFMLLVSPLLFSEMRTLGRFYHQKSKAEAAAQRFVDVFKNDVIHPNNSTFNGIAWLNFKVCEPSIKAKQLCINEKDWIHLIGPSGSGKTVLLEALCGFRQASHSLSGNVALLSQHVALLDKSLRNNLTLGKLNLSDSQLIQSLEEVGLNEWYTHLTEGLDAELSDYPALSGGEAQRLALARILLHNKDIVLLDEPTAHLTEKQHNDLSKLIHKKLYSKTVVWASHKPLPSDWFCQSWFINSGVIEVTK